MDRKAELGGDVLRLAREIVVLQDEETQILQELCSEHDVTPDVEERLRHNQETLLRKRREHTEAKDALKNLLRLPGGVSMSPPLPRSQSQSASRVPSATSSRRASVGLSSGSEAELQAKAVASSDSEQAAKPSREVKSRASALAAAAAAGPDEWVGQLPTPALAEPEHHLLFPAPRMVMRRGRKNRRKTKRPDSERPKRS